MTDVEIAVVGGGLMGSAAARALARRGHSVALFEQYAFGHDRGSSHGSARIFRRAYADSLYVRMTGEAYELWRELERDSGESLLRLTGGLDFGLAREPERIAESLAANGVEHELLSADAAAERWPGIVFDTAAVFHPQAGTVDAENTISAFLRLAGNEGTALFDQTPVERIKVGSDRVDIVTHRGRTSAKIVVVAAGAWVEDLLHNVLTLPPLTVSQQQVFHFPRRDPTVAWPIFVYKDDVNVYGLPGGRDGGPSNGQKMAEHDGGRRTTASSRDGYVDPMARERLLDVVRRRFPGLVPRPFAESTCLYTTTPDDDFVLDRSGAVIVASPCSGHGAKFAPLIGEMIADLALDSGRREPRFRIDRGRDELARVD